MTDESTGLDLPMLKSALGMEITFRTLMRDQQIVPMLEQAIRAISMLEVAIGAHAVALTQIQELTSEVATYRAMLNG